MNAGRASGCRSCGGPRLEVFLTLGELPLVDSYSVQIDCWSDSDAEVEQLAEAVRNAIEAEHHITSFGPNGRDPETMRYRIGMTFTFWNPR